MSDENDRGVRNTWDFVFRVFYTILHTSNKRAIEAIGQTFVFLAFVLLAFQLNAANTAITLEDPEESRLWNLLWTVSSVFAMIWCAIAVHYLCSKLIK